MALEEKNQVLVVPDEAFLIAISRDLSDEEMALLKEYGKVVVFQPKVYNNIPIESIDFDYLILDIRQSDDRHYLQRVNVQTLEKYNFVSVCHSIQKSEEFHEEMGVDNVLTKLPPKQAFKADFDRMMLQKKISKPNAGISCIKSVFRLFNGQWN